MRRGLIVALVLTLTGLLVALQFVLRTTGGTLFVFATIGPILIFFSIAILAGLLLYEFRQRHRLFEVETYETGQVIFHQGDAGDCAYFIRSGEVEVVRERKEGGPILIAKLGKGQYFGEMALLGNEPRNATIRASAPTELAVLGKRNFLPLLGALPSVQQDVMKTVQDRAMRAGKRV